jgi:ABC-type dipeptide/oligopeptide/nickel transport system ATPase subunit
MAMEGLLIQNVSQVYMRDNGEEFHALKEVNFFVPKGENLLLEGESGSGKSTLARLLIGLEKPTSGSILFDDEDVTKWNFITWRKHRKQIQAVFQDAAGTLNPARTAYHNVEESLVNLTDFNVKDRRAKILALMEEVKLNKSLLDVPVRRLSGGEQRRLSLLRAIAVEPDYLILDEVTSGLDLKSENLVLDMIENYTKNHNCTCIFITHNRNNAMRISNKIAVMQGGKIAKIGKFISNKENVSEDIEN